MKRRVFLIIPAYNESAVISQVIRGLEKAFSSTNYEPVIVVVDDGSSDQTARLSKKSGARVIKHILNTGSGGATATGLSLAQRQGCNIAATLDADGQHDPEDVIKGISMMEKGGYDLLIGSRLIDHRGMSKLKRMGNKGLSFITYILFGVNVTDSQSGLRIFSKRALRELHWKTNGYEFCSEMLWRAKQLQLNIGEYPIKAIYTEYSKSKGQNNWNAINIIKALVRHRLMEIFYE